MIKPSASTTQPARLSIYSLRGHRAHVNDSNSNITSGIIARVRSPGWLGMEMVLQLTNKLVSEYGKGKLIKLRAIVVFGSNTEYNSTQA